jgi:ribonuclease R
MDRVAKAIRRRRLDEGMLELDLPEVDVILDDAGHPTDARPADTSFSHKIIEAFMVEANEAVGRLLRDLGVPFIRRIHPEPDDAALEAMARFLRASGLALPRSLGAKDLQSLLTSLRGRPEAYAVNLAVLKSLQLAEYSPEAVGHFGLGSDCYTHFTSPIRRYTDLMVHRLLGLYLDGRLKRGQRAFGDDVPGDDQLVEAGRRLSYLSRRAESAEREFKTLKILQMLTRQAGEVFEGVVTGVTNFGLFVQHPRYLIDGLLRIEHLGDDWWEVDLKSGRVVGARTHRVFTLGTRAAVQIAEVDLAARQLNLALPPDEARKTRRTERPPATGKPRRIAGRPRVRGARPGRRR